MQQGTKKLIARFLARCLIVTVSGSLYIWLANNQYEAFWAGNRTALWLYGGAPDARFARPLARMEARARSMGLKFKDPALVQTNRLFDIWYVRWFKSDWIGVTVSTGTSIVEDDRWMTPRFADSELDCVMAHELGHVIDYQTNRIGHPMFDRMQCLAGQEFADTFGQILCGVEPYRSLMRRHIKERPLITRTCDETTPVP